MNKGDIPMAAFSLLTPIPPKWKKLMTPNDIARCQDAHERSFKERQTKTIFPNEKDIFRALQYTDPENVKCIILGQDPYHGIGQAQGLAFSVDKNCRPIPPSLFNILTEYNNDFQTPHPKTGDLTAWAENGVLLLNTILTVEQGKPLSHENFGWQSFTQTILKIALQNDHNQVMLNWGTKAINLANETIKQAKPTTLVQCFNTTHPSPYSANKAGRYPTFIGSKPFTKTNQWLLANNETPIDWRL